MATKITVEMNEEEKKAHNYYCLEQELPSLASCSYITLLKCYFRNKV